jgi:transposase-like protein
MDARAVAAVRNNAEWCDAVCRAHGITTSFDPHVWVALRRSPPMYPDAVTLTECASASDVLRVDGCRLPAASASSASVRCASG